MTQPKIGFWALWVAACSIFGLSLALTALFIGYVGLFYAAFGGIVLGSLQGIVLRRYVVKMIAIPWVCTTAIAWFGAVSIVYVSDFMTEMGSGLNPDANISSCGINACIAAGIIFSSIQRIQVHVFEPAIWIIANSFAWGSGALIGGAVGILVSDPHQTIYPFLITSYDPTGMAVGVFTGTTIYGILSGLVALGLLRSRRHFEKGQI